METRLNPNFTCMYGYYIKYFKFYMLHVLDMSLGGKHSNNLFTVLLLVLMGNFLFNFPIRMYHQ